MSIAGGARCEPRVLRDEDAVHVRRDCPSSTRDHTRTRLAIEGGQAVLHACHYFQVATVFVISPFQNCSNPG